MRIILQGIALLLLTASSCDGSEAGVRSNFASGADYAVATASRDATNIGMQVLASGGSAVDAALAVQMVLGVVEPQSSGLGGGAVALYRTAQDGKVRAFDGLAKSSAAYQASASDLPGFLHSGAAVGVPGSLRMLEMMHRQYGRLPWNTLFQRAIELADAGFVVSPYLARSLASATKAGMEIPTWLSDATGKPATEGTTVRNPDLAATLRRIARDGADALYVASAGTVVDTVRRFALPGQINVADVENYMAVEREPICMQLLQHVVCTCPPPSYGGVAVLEMLGMLKQDVRYQTPFRDLGFLHRFIEAGRLAEADRMGLVGDPDIQSLSARDVLEPAYIKARAALIKQDRAMTDPVFAGWLPPVSSANCLHGKREPAPSTSQISIVDAYGNALSMTTTINVNFGAWATIGGFFLNNAMTNFDAVSDRGCSANAPASGKRPETAMAPVLAMSSKASVVLIGGSAGAGEIVDYVVQAIIELLAGRDPAAALDDGHISTARTPYPETAGVVELEQGRAVAQFAPWLQALGHKTRVVSLQSGTAFLVRRRGHWEGAADPRRDGMSAIARSKN
jgi:gamma-glutamyltranspeptidase/glutathione hydrolase